MKTVSILLRVAAIIAFLFCLAKSALDAVAYLVGHTRLVASNSCADQTLAYITIILCLSSVALNQYTQSSK